MSDEFNQLMPGLRVDWSRRALSEEQKWDVIRLAQKRGTSYAADMTGLDGKKIRKLAREMGTSVTAKSAPMKPEVKEAIKEKQDDRRVVLKQKLLDRAHDLADRMGATYSIVTRDGEIIEINRPPARETKDFAIALGIVVDKMRLEMGEATSKTETVQRDQVDDELQKLAMELAQKAAQDEMSRAVATDSKRKSARG